VARRKSDADRDAAAGGAPGDVGNLLAGSVGFLLSKLGFMSASGFAAALEPENIHPGHFALLRMIKAAEGSSQNALGDSLHIPPSRMVALLDELEQRGLVERRRSPADRRINLVHLTDAGVSTLERAAVIAADWEARLCAGLDDDERATLAALLRRLAEGHDLPVGVHPGLARP
jgi:DNA-binding MarR family transcriptional regulator